MKEKSKIKQGTIIKRKDNQLFSEIDGEVVMLSVENSEYYGMDKVGSRIWQILEKEIKFRDLISLLIEEYDVTEDQCIKDTMAFLEMLDEKGLITISAE